MRRTLNNTPLARRNLSLPLRLLGMAVSVVALIAGSSRTRRMPPGQKLTVSVNTLFFVALGAADEWLLAPVLDEQPLARAAALTGETLALGWFFSPGGAKPASRMLFYVHVGPFFLAVFSGALGVALARGWRSHAA
jgi:hypothetical protein